MLFTPCIIAEPLWEGFWTRGENPPADAGRAHIDIIGTCMGRAVDLAGVWL